MKKIRRTAILIVAAAILVTSCGNVSGGRIDSGEIVVPEMSSEDLLVSSLEYLLQEDEDTTKEAEEISDADTSQETEEKNADESEKGNVEIVQPEPERMPEKNEAVIYYGNAGSYELKREIIQIEEKSADELVDALAKHNIVSLDTKVLSFEEKEGAGEKILHLELSRAAGEYLKTMSREAECIILASVVNTFLENYDADGVHIAVDGKPLTTKNAEYAEALQKCTPEELLKKIERSDNSEIGEPEEKETVSENGMDKPEDTKEVSEAQEED